MSLGRYVDLTEAIDASDSSFLDNTEFQDADAIPLQDTLPERHYLDNEVRPLRFLSLLSLTRLAGMPLPCRTTARTCALGFSRW